MDVPKTDIDSLQSAVGSTSGIAGLSYNEDNYVTSGVDSLEVAIGKLDAQIKDNADSIAAGSDDQTAAEVSFTGAVATDWDGDVAPANVKLALDQLAERIDDEEIALSTHEGLTNNPHSVTKAQVLSGDLIVNADVDASA